MKKLLSLALALLMIMSLAVTATAEEIPEVKVLNGFSVHLDNNADPINDAVTEVTGFKTVWENLPSENMNQQLMLLIAGGASYDIIHRVGIDAVNDLNKQGALLDLKPLLEQYGQDILRVVPDMAWAMVTSEDGKIYGIPYTNYSGHATKAKWGSLHSGLCFNMGALKEMGEELPTTLDDLVRICEKWKEATGNPALTISATGFVQAIYAAFDYANGWYANEEDKLVHSIRDEAYVEYLSFMQDLYAKGYLDNDFPINTTASAREKFTTGTSIITTLAFYDVDAIYAAMTASGLEPYCEIVGALKHDAEHVPTYRISQSYSAVSCIPVTAENPERAIQWLNSLTQEENFCRVFLGEEGVSYTYSEEDGYNPIFPEFSNYANGTNYVGVPEAASAFAMWQARARKTATIAAAYTGLSDRAFEYNAVNTYVGYAAGLASNVEYSGYLNEVIGTTTLAAIASGEDAQAVADGLIAEWEANGGLEMEKEYDEWYQANKHLMD